MIDSLGVTVAQTLQISDILGITGHAMPDWEAYGKPQRDIGASAHRRRRRDLRARSLKTFNSLGRIEGGDGLAIGKARQRRGVGKNRSSNSLLALAPRYRSFFLFRNPANFLRPENV
jgi:hypothetical protein